MARAFISQFAHKWVTNGRKSYPRKTKSGRPLSIVLRMAMRIGNVLLPFIENPSAAHGAFLIESRTVMCHFSPKICFLPSYPSGGLGHSLSMGIQKGLVWSSEGKPHCTRVNPPRHFRDANGLINRQELIMRPMGLWVVPLAQGRESNLYGLSGIQRPFFGVADLPPCPDLQCGRSSHTAMR